MNHKNQIAYYSLITILFLNAFSCKSNSCEGTNSTDSIVVFYYTGWRESPIRKSLTEVSEKAMEKNTDTVLYLKDSEYNRVLSIINNKKHIDNQDIDCRMFVQYDSVKIALGYPDIFIPESNDTCIYGYDHHLKRIQVNANNIYYLRCICGYYNFFSKEELMYDKLIHKWGMPNNYCNRLENNTIIKSNADNNKDKSNIVVTATKLSNNSILKIVNSRKVVIKKKNSRNQKSFNQSYYVCNMKSYH